MSAVTQGALVEVYWPDDDAWYRGKVGKIDFDWKVSPCASPRVCNVMKAPHMKLQCHPSPLLEQWNVRGCTWVSGVISDVFCVCSWGAIECLYFCVILCHTSCQSVLSRALKSTVLLWTFEVHVKWCCARSSFAV